MISYKFFVNFDRFYYDDSFIHPVLCNIDFISVVGMEIFVV